MRRALDRLATAAHAISLAALGAALTASCSFPPARFDVMMRAGPRLDEAADAVVECLQTLGSAQP